MKGDLILCIVMLEESGLSLPTPFPWRSSPCVVELGGWVIWRREVAEPDQGFVRCQLEEKVYLYLFSRLIKMWCPSSSQIIVQCVIESLFLIIWWCYSDHLFHIYLIIIVLYVVIMVWGRYNLACRSLGARGARRGLKRKLRPAFS